MTKEDQPDLFGGSPDQARRIREDQAVGNAKDLLKRWIDLAKLFQAVGKVNVEKATGCSDLERALEKAPPADTLQRVVEELRQRTESWLQQEKKLRREGFGKIEATLIQELRNTDEPLRELDSSWRIGPLELELRRERAQARALYNREQVIAWKPIGSVEDLRALLEKANTGLEKAAVPESLWADVLWTSYGNLTSEIANRAPSSAPRVLLVDLFRECRVELVRRQLHTGRPEQKLRYSEFPLWVYLHNLDLYRRLGSSVPTERRLTFETGSQAESQTHGLVLNGLDRKQDYKVFCYVHA